VRQPRGPQRKRGPAEKEEERWSEKEKIKIKKRGSVVIERNGKRDGAREREGDQLGILTRPVPGHYILYGL
jgi:hypothetical protein